MLGFKQFAWLLWLSNGTDIKEEYFYTKTGTCQWSYGSSYGKEPARCSLLFVHHVYYYLDGQFGSITFNNQSHKTMESVCGQPGEESRSSHKWLQYHLKVLPN